ncbi:hypothetical protein CK203_073847 [Vitis vinifera]|uniref:Wbp11/ELF5/Saf1 N-terminal domain-containing protein n=1 Tax=Vitis vinifera TaxID=29760 RepID=A0A438DJA6_VITVI|nr:hypothetical protein CK203_073847 [Vitis vinifera]
MKTKGGKVMNPTDAYRKELRKKELKRVFFFSFSFFVFYKEQERKEEGERGGDLKKDPETLREQIDKLEMMSGAFEASVF